MTYIIVIEYYAIIKITKEYIYCHENIAVQQNYIEWKKKMHLFLHVDIKWSLTGKDLD